MIAGLCLALILGLVSSALYGYKVEVDGRVIGYTKEATTFAQSLNSIEEAMREETGVSTAIVYNDIEVKRGFLLGKEEYSREDFIHIMDNMDLTTGVEGVEISVDGVAVGKVSDDETAENTINAAVNKTAGVVGDDKVVSCEIKSDIKTESVNFPLSELKTLDECSDTMVNGNNTEDKNNTNNLELLMVASRGGSVVRDEDVPLNEDPASANANNQSADESNDAATSSGIIKVNLIKTSKVLEDIPFAEEIQEDPNLNVGSEEIRQTGEVGTKEKEVELQYEDGVVISQKIISERVVKEPVSQVVSKGIRTFSTIASNDGKYILPANGLITALDKPGSHSGCFAVDIAAPTGTPIYAPADGTVTLASVSGGYGMCVEITMDDGTMFRLGHNSAYKVSVGDKVKQGDVVALMGSTGNSTGPHCHFELWIGGVKQFLPNFWNLAEGKNV